MYHTSLSVTVTPWDCPCSRTHSNREGPTQLLRPKCCLDVVTSNCAFHHLAFNVPHLADFTCHIELLWGSYMQVRCEQLGMHYSKLSVFVIFSNPQSYLQTMLLAASMKLVLA